MNDAAKNMNNVIVVGGGVAGLSTALQLQKHNYSVTVLEASDRLGGRIQTIRDSGFLHPVERGVEFIHGNLPLTMQLLKEAEIEYTAVEGKMIRVVNGEWKTQDDFTIGWQELMEKMNALRQDMSLNKFLEQNFSDDKYRELRNSVLRFAGGFDLADPAKASVLSLREEWMSEEEEQFRIHGGCDQIIEYLEKQCRQSGINIHMSSAVAEIQWQKDKVLAKTQHGKTYQANKIILTVSLGMLLSEPSTINFNPFINEHLSAAKKIGFGSVVKVMLQFKERFWEERKNNIGFLLTEEAIPTWWTQLPSSQPLLTGWAGGPQAWKLEDKDDSTILALALQSLSNVFKKPIEELEQSVTASSVANWSIDSFAKGGYSYSMVGSRQSQKLFSKPIDGTIYFAGEAFYDGPSPGTVEAALVSGKNVVEKICKFKK